MHLTHCNQSAAGKLSCTKLMKESHPFRVSIKECSWYRTTEICLHIFTFLSAGTSCFLSSTKHRISFLDIEVLNIFPLQVSKAHTWIDSKSCPPSSLCQLKVFFDSVVLHCLQNKRGFKNDEKPRNAESSAQFQYLQESLSNAAERIRNVPRPHA